GLLYRFLPRSPGRLAEGGRLQALAFESGGSDSRNWRQADRSVGEVRAVRWIDLDEVESPRMTFACGAMLREASCSPGVRAFIWRRGRMVDAMSSSPAPREEIGALDRSSA
ncbi:MAG: hypothetical protein ACK5YD_03395, partial [Phenylobacterium sp.]